MSERQLAELPNYRTSTAFAEEERLVLDFATEMTATPVQVPEALFERLRARFSEEQIVELTAAIAWENYRARFDHALGIEAQGFSSAE